MYDHEVRMLVCYNSCFSKTKHLPTPLQKWIGDQSNIIGLQYWFTRTVAKRHISASITKHI